MAAAVSMGYNPNIGAHTADSQRPVLQNPRYYPQRPGTQGGIAMGPHGGSPTSLGGGAVHDVAARVKKYKQSQYQQSQ